MTPQIQTAYFQTEQEELYARAEAKIAAFEESVKTLNEILAEQYDHGPIPAQWAQLVGVRGGDSMEKLVKIAEKWAISRCF